MSAQTSPRADDALVAVVLFGVHMPIVPASYDSPLRAEVERFVERASSHVTGRPHPDTPFQRYLTLLAAHRWLCAGEFQEFEGDAQA